jgi:hypothetical protein
LNWNFNKFLIFLFFKTSPSTLSNCDYDPGTERLDIELRRRKEKGRRKKSFLPKNFKNL